jgi:hypothetical protein
VLKTGFCPYTARAKSSANRIIKDFVEENEVISRLFELALIDNIRDSEPLPV